MHDYVCFEMENSVISFPCPVCAIKLTVPAYLVGVTGPCPSCRSQIQAVHSPLVLPEIPQVGPPILPPQAQPATEPAASIAVPHEPPCEAEAPQVGVQRNADANQSDCLFSDHAPMQPKSSMRALSEPTPLPQVIPPTIVLDSKLVPASAPVLPELGPLLIRSSDQERPAGRRPNTRHSQVKIRFKRLLFFLLFIMAVVTIGSGVVSFLRDRSERERSKYAISKISVPTNPTRKVSQREPLDSPKAPDAPILIPPRSTSAEPLFVDATPSPAGPLETSTPSQAATKILEKFLAAQTLTERLSLVVTQTPEPTLAKSCLAGPLPKAKEIFIEAIENNAAEQVVNFYHHVTFDTEDLGEKSQTILIQQRGPAEPKVVIDPFLDSYGGRLAIYAKAPSDQSGTFQVTILPLAACCEESVPSRDEKLTLKLLPQDDAKEIALAFFSKQSKIAQTLEDGTYSLSYGKAKACTVILRWNTEERPETPYLEAVALKALDWNP